MTGPSPDRRERLKKILLEASELSDEARTLYLDLACAGDPELRREVESLLGHDRAIGGADAVSLVRTEFLAHDKDSLGTVLDRYRLLRILGEGGMGVVYEAEQTEPIQRRVALKRVRSREDGGRALERFRAERQTLAKLDHPGIARVLDANADRDGRPFFVMELVDGVPITRYCAERGLPLEARLRLFVLVCEAVQHAHQKGVLHRDLKPSNVLVTTVDGRPQPKVIDFGIAKALEGDGTPDETTSVEQATLAGQAPTTGRLPSTGPATSAGQAPATEFASDASDTASHASSPERKRHPGLTRAGELVGTPEYMSPEQASGETGAVDARTDIYALGMLLYELLAGQLPFPSERFRDASVSEILRIVREEQPTRPSERLAASPSPASGAPGSSTSPSASTPAVATSGTLQKLPRDLDWVVLRALEKSPSERYASASELAADIERFLDGRPVEAAPQSSGYRLGKFAARHRTLLAGATALAVALLLGIVGTAWQAHQASLERARAEKNLDRIRDLSQDFLFEVYDQVRPLAGSTPVREYIASAASDVLEEIAQDPRDLDTIRATLIASYTRLGSVELDLGRNEAAERSLNEAVRLSEEALAKSGDDPKITRLLAATYSQLGRERNITGDVAGSKEFHEKALVQLRALTAAYPDSSTYRFDVSAALLRLGFNLVRMARPEEALPLYEEAIDIRDTMREELTPDDVAYPWAFRGECLEALGRQEEALASYRHACDTFEEAVAKDPDDAFVKNRLAVTLGAVGGTLSDLGRPDEAASILERSLELRSELVAGDPENVVATRDLAKGYYQLGEARLAAGDVNAAMTAFEAGMPIVRTLYEADPSDAHSARYLSLLLQANADARWRVGQRDEARGMLAEALGIDEHLLQVDSGRDDHYFRQLESHRIEMTWALETAQSQPSTRNWSEVRRLAGLVMTEADAIVRLGFLDANEAADYGVDEARAALAEANDKSPATEKGTTP
ncbi:MAG: protein kinase [Candidatus Eisenbacteria bacterium]|nr:protein kinase [Candidatus Eisenbacteria bacterium]